MALGIRYFGTSTRNLGIALQIVRLRADANLDTVTAALRSLNTEKNVNTRFAVVKATVGEGEERAFLVEANHKKDKDADLLATAGADKRIILSTKDSSGNDIRVTGKVYSHTHGGNSTASRWLNLAAAGGLVCGGWVGMVTAIGGTLPVNPAPGPVFAAIVGLAAVVGAVAAFRQFIIRSDGADWARVTVDSLSEGKPVPVEVYGIEQAPVAVAALPAPTESPFLIPPVSLPVREKVTA